MEPAADLGMALALTSSLRNAPLANGMAALGEIGLGGELRSVSQLPRRLAELSRMGFGSCVIPEPATGALEAPQGLKALGAETLAQGLGLALPSPARRGRANQGSGE